MRYDPTRVADPAATDPVSTRPALKGGLAMKGRIALLLAVGAVGAGIAMAWLYSRDMRATADYRMLASKNLLRRLFAETQESGAPLQVSRHRAA